ncbi:MAG: class I SAM-dependent methyltransferase [Sandaracinaceae bacterium]
MSSSLTSFAYRAQHLSVMVPTTLFNATMRYLAHGQGGPMPAPRAIAHLQQRYRELLEADLANVEEGLYPRRLLFSLPLGAYARRLPRMLADLPRVMRRRSSRAWRDLPSEVDLSTYPPYFRRTYHWQSDGYLSRRSASLYDLEVEVLFGGAADVMRRQALAPISRWLRDREPGGAAPRLLDVACGTGRFLSQVATAHPSLKLYGLDLSPFYVQEARRTLADVTDVSLVADNAEAMPFRDASFDLVSCIYLFHELPRNARRRVLGEIARVLAPGGRVVIEDSAQLVESPELAFFLERFPEQFHEPYYADYLKDDLAMALAAAGLEVESVTPAFVAKVVVARKPG